MSVKRVVVGAALGAALAAGLLAWRELWPRTSVGPRAVLNGGDAGGLPRSQPRDEHFDATALESAAAEPVASGLVALVVMRHDHIVFERYGAGFASDTVVDLGAFARVLAALLAGIAAQEDQIPTQVLHGFDAERLRAAIEAGTHQSYAQYLSRKLWSRLNAAPAWIALSAANAPARADCCVHARVLDWMRVASVLLDDGRFEGEQVVPPAWVALMLRPDSADGTRGFGLELAGAAQGTASFGADGVFFLRGPGRWRLWLVPSLKLAVLFGADAPASSPPWDETRLPNLVIRALGDSAAQRGTASRLQQLVPGH